MRGKRRDIQGLRALAVTLVVVFHLWPERLSGGYLGVDIFFVISGYLITAHLRREAKETGRIDLPRFWARRARRLLPAAMTVLAFCIFVTAMLIPITGRETISKQILAAGTYFLNWMLAATSLNYFTSGSSWSPVTHYWSLSVEEQFYLVWPLLIVACLYFGRHKTPRARDLMILLTFGVVLIGSLSWAIISTHAEPAAAYFETTGHAWEFAVGGLLTFTSVPGVATKARLLAPVWAAWIFLVIAAFVLNGESRFPGVLAIVPVASTAFIIWSADFEHRLSPSRIIALRPIQFTGDISYSLYLWHWPLLFAAPLLLGREITARDKMVIVGLTIVVAYLSKRFIEDPILTSNWRPIAGVPWALASAAAAMAILVLIAGYSASQMNRRATQAAESLYRSSLSPGMCFGAQSVLSGGRCVESHFLRSMDSTLVDWSHQINGFTNGTACQADRGATKILNCAFGVPEGTQTRNVALIGDSHAGMWATALGSISKENGLRVTTYLESGCPATLDPDVAFAADLTNASGCRRWRESAIDLVARDQRIDTVVTSSKDQSYVGSVDSNGVRRLDSGDGYVKAWKKWLAAGKSVVVINEVPERSRPVPSCIAASGSMRDPCAIESAVVSGNGPLAQAAAQIRDPKFLFLDFHRVFCDDELCHAVIGGIPAYMDTDHISAPFARSFADQFRVIVSLGGIPRT